MGIKEIFINLIKLKEFILKIVGFLWLLVLESGEKIAKIFGVRKIKKVVALFKKI